MSSLGIRNFTSIDAVAVDINKMVFENGTHSISFSKMSFGGDVLN